MTRNLPIAVKRLLLGAVDVGAISASIITAFWLRLGWPIEPQYLDFLRTYFVPFVMTKLVIFFGFGMYRRLWRYASIRDLRALIQAVAVSSLTILFFSYALGTLPIPRSVLIVDGLLTIITVGGIRFSGRTLAEIRLYGATPKSAHRILIIGAGDAGEMLAKEMLKNPVLGYWPIGFIDDDPQKRKMSIHGVRVLGGRDDLKAVIEASLVGEVIIAMPSVSRQAKEGVVNVCKETGVRCRTVPGIYELIGGRVDIGQIRDVQIEDVLGRDPVRVDLDEIGKFIQGTSVLVTGAGGSIGSELCRQISLFKPLVLVMVDIAENSLFHIEQELLSNGLCPIVAAVGDVKDEARMDEILDTHDSQIIFHAAAYKHVPMMEMNPKAALENNFVGTSVLARAASRHGVGKFILISTDKAVNPVNVMGISKAMAEKAVLSIAAAGTEFAVVRFGNVLASNGSVVPIFQRQIAAGGPITITHPEMKRYLMTITESVQLVLQAAAFGGAGEMYLLDMGEQVSIVELAEKLVHLSGLDMERIGIKYIGARPGEKLEEELASESETQTPTAHPKIVSLRDARLDPESLRAQLPQLESLVRQGRTRAAFSLIQLLIPMTTAEPEMVEAVKVD